jgi:transcriptional regulator with XRE-family HTH domain
MYTPAHLRSLRERALLTQADVQQMTGLSRRSVIKLERGITRPRFSTLRRLLTLYQTCINTNEARDRAWSI